MKRETEIREKARELAIKYCKGIDNHGKEVYDIGCAFACCEMADWADQHPREGLWDAEKVISFLKENATVENSCNINIHINGATYHSVNDFIEDLRKAMETES